MPRARRRWHVLVRPHDLYEILPANTLDSGTDSAHLQSVLEARGVARKVALRWPQRIGFRVTLKLAERDRIAFAIMSDRRDLRQAGRVSVRKYNDRVCHLGSDAVLAALRAAGQRFVPQK
jgi:hypothetical protein